MKHFYFYLISFSIFFHLSGAFGEFNWGSVCTTEGECCILMANSIHLFGPINYLEDAINAIDTMVSAYPIYESASIMERVSERYGLLMAEAYYMTQGNLLADEICDWVSDGYLWDARCESRSNQSDLTAKYCQREEPEWTDSHPGYQSTPVSYFFCADCYTHPVPAYRCAAGYWGKTENGEGGCNPCPVNEHNIRGTTAPWATEQNQCYIPAGTTFSDSTGSGTYAGDSYYCE